MHSKILPFNKTLFKKDWKMTKWISYLIIIILFFTMTLEIVGSYSDFQETIKQVEEHPEYHENFDLNEYKNGIKSFIEYRFKNLTGMEIPLIIFSPIAVATLLFGEEKRRKTFEVLATMPFGRWEIFFNKLIIAFINIILPFLINSLIMIMALGLSKSLREFYSIGLVMSWLGANIFRLFIVLSFSFLFATLTGTTISQVVLTIIFLIFPIGFTALIGFNMSAWGYDPLVIDKFLDAFAKYTPIAIIDNTGIPIGFHLISAIIMLIVAKLLFDRNKLERSGETLEFESLETFFKIGVTTCASLLGGVIFSCFDYLSGFSINIWIILGYIVGIVLGWLVVTYSIKFNKSKA